jgi:trans-2-enoyl-CoA reductase
LYDISIFSNNFTATAYRLLRDFGAVPGDVIIQNGANSMVGLAVIQMAKLMGIKTINIIRTDRPGTDDVRRIFETLGGDVNITDDLINTPEFREILADLPPCKLAFNCIGGESTTEMIRCLDTNATVVTYGGMSKKPLTIPFDILASKQLQVKGFWMANWYETHGIAAKTEMINDIVDLIRNKQLTFFYEVHDFDDFHHALDISTQPYRLRKVILNLDHPDRLKEHDAKDPAEYKIFELPVN